MSILECVLVTATADGISLTASDKELTIQTKHITAEVDSVGSVALDAKLFSDIVRKLPGDFVTIEIDETNTALCKSGRSSLKIVGLPGEEFPLPDVNTIKSENGVSYTLKSHILKDMIKQTIFAVSLDQSRPVLTGELMAIKDNALRIVAVDMFRISYAAQLLEGDFADADAVVPGKALNELSRILPGAGQGEDEEAVVNLFFTDKNVVFENDTFTMVSSLLEGDFVRYDQIFNEDFATLVTVNRAALLSAFERAILVAVENRMPPTKLEINNNDLLISVQNERGQVNDGLPCDTDGNELTIHFNPRYFIEALKAIDTENVMLRFNSQLSPCIIKGVDSNVDCKYLIVPLRPPA